METLLLDTPKGRFRLCKECYTTFESSKLNDQYKGVKERVKLYGIDSTDAYQLMKDKEKFLKDLKKK